MKIHRIMGNLYDSVSSFDWSNQNSNVMSSFPKNDYAGSDYCALLSVPFFPKEAPQQRW